MPARAALAVLLGASLALLGCDAGGLLLVENKATPAPPPVNARSATELVNGGTVARNVKYKMFYVLGQPSPQQGAAASPTAKVNGGLTGAAHPR